MNKRIRVGIVGGAGYTGGELLRILLYHPLAEIAFVMSNSNAGKKVSLIHKDLFGETDISFSSNFEKNIDVLFLCSAHGDSIKFLEKIEVEDKIKVIDLSQDFRLANSNTFNNRTFVYGLVEKNKQLIELSQNIANPGCFATAIQLALLPLASEKKLLSPIHISGVTGSTGAGQSLSPTSHFSWRNNNFSSYKVFNHQHLLEVNESLSQLQKNELPKVNFIPYRGGFTRGILITIYFETELSEKDAITMYKSYYDAHLFTHVSESELDLKQVVNTNKCLIHIKKVNETLFITSIIDNLLKGASGQAVQNMNLMFGIDERTGLNLKPSAF